MLGPILIGGVGRSGTTLMMAILDSHPDLLVLPELHCWSCPPLRDLIESGDKPLLNRFRRAGLTQFPSPDSSWFDNEWRGDTLRGRCSYVEECIRINHRPTTPWGMKIMNDIRQADQFLEVWPEARFVCMIRDPRDCYASQRLYGGMGKGGPTVSAESWVKTAKAVWGSQAYKNKRAVMVKYETLVRLPAEVLKGVLPYIGLEWNDQVLEHEKHPHILTSDASVSHYSRNQIRFPVYTKSIGRWKADLTEEDVLAIEAVASQEMTEWGYELSR